MGEHSPPRYEGQHEIRLFRRTVDELESGTALPAGWKPMKIEYLDGNRVRITCRFWHPERKQPRSLLPSGGMHDAS